MLGMMIRKEVVLPMGRRWISLRWLGGRWLLGESCDFEVAIGLGGFASRHHEDQTGVLFCLFPPPFSCCFGRVFYSKIERVDSCNL